MNASPRNRRKGAAFLAIAVLASAGGLSGPRAGAQETRLASRQSHPLFVVHEEGTYGFIDRRGNLVIPLQYRFSPGFADGLAPVFVDGGCGYIDETGQMVIEAHFKYCQPFMDDFAGVQTDNGWTFIDRSGRLVSSFFFDSVAGFKDGWGAVELHDEWGLIDSNGSMVRPLQYRGASPLAGGRAIVYHTDDWRCSVIDVTGAVVLQPEPTDCRGSLEDGMIIRERDLRAARYTYIRADGSLLAPFIFEWADGFADGLAAVRMGGAVGFIDTAGQVIIAPQFDADPSRMCNRSFSEGLAAVMLKGKCGFVDETGSIAIEPRFDLAREFQSGLAFVCVDRQCGYIDQMGAVIWMAAAS